MAHSVRDLLAACPHGATVATEGGRQNFDIVGIVVREVDGAPALLGWAYPNKDMWFFPEQIVMRGDGDWTFSSKGIRLRFAPLSKERADAVDSMMAEA